MPRSLLYQRNLSKPSTGFTYFELALPDPLPAVIGVGIDVDLADLQDPAFAMTVQVDILRNRVWSPWWGVTLTGGPDNDSIPGFEATTQRLIAGETVRLSYSKTGGVSVRVKAWDGTDTPDFRAQEIIDI